MSNDVYSQRNTLAVALAWMTIKAGGSAGRGFDQATADKGAEAGWGHVLYIDTPGGDQISYHMSPADAALLDGLPQYEEEWDEEYTGRESWWLNQYRPVFPVKGETAEETAIRRLSPVSLRRWFIEQSKLYADLDVTGEAREAILRGYAERWS